MITRQKEKEVERSIKWERMAIPSTLYGRNVYGFRMSQKVWSPSLLSVPDLPDVSMC